MAVNCSDLFLLKRRPRWLPHVIQPNFATCSEVNQYFENGRPKFAPAFKKREARNCPYSTGFTTFTTTSRLQRKYHRNEWSYWRMEKIFNHVHNS